jgi:hypothetical protein
MHTHFTWAKFAFVGRRGWSFHSGSLTCKSATQDFIPPRGNRQRPHNLAVFRLRNGGFISLVRRKEGLCHKTSFKEEVE